MTYSDLLDKLKEHGLSELGRMKQGDGDWVALLGRQDEVIVPFAFESHPVYLYDGDDTEIDEEIYQAILRRFNGPSRKRKLETC